MNGSVVCAGGAVQDLTFRLHAAAVPATSNPSALSSSFGGVARNVAVDLAVLGLDVQLVTAIGRDDAGRALVRDLEVKGVGAQHVQVIDGAVTAQYAAVIDPDGELVIGLAAMDVLGLIDIGPLDEAWPEPGHWVFCDANLRADVLAHVVRRAEVSGVRLVIDAVSAPKVTRLPGRLEGIAMLSCNAHEAQTWLRHNGFDDADDPIQLAAALVDAGAGAALVTFGAGGVATAERIASPSDEDDYLIRVEPVPAESVHVVDVTGAGDALIAGAMAALIKGQSLIEAAQAGQRLAARVVQSPASTIS